MKLLSLCGKPPRLSFALALLSSLPCAAASNASGKTATPPVPRPLHVYRAMIPLGSEVFSFNNSREREVFYVMVSAHNREFEGQQLYADGEKRFLKTSAGVTVKQYPHQMHFRISVSEREGYSPLEAPFPVEAKEPSFSEFISQLKFEMRIFHALTARILRPVSIKHIGIPPDVPASERIYDVTFDLGDVPIDDRIVMHVLTSQGDRLAKFNFDLF
jgi:hypothetical protein